MRKRCTSTRITYAHWSTDCRPLPARASVSIGWSCCSPTAHRFATSSSSRTSDQNRMNKPLWQPSPARVAATNLMEFIRLVEIRHGFKARDYAALYDWSVREPELFWKTLWEYGGVIAETQGTRTLVNGGEMPGAKWFP